MNIAGGADTSLGGRERRFPETRWSRFLNTPSGTGGAEALRVLAESYWRPVYAYLRSRWGESNEDAKDLTQDFFLWIVDGGLLAKADPSRGRFRAFLKSALDNFAGGEHRKRRTLKRGGDRGFLKIDGPLHDLAELGITDSRARSPDQVLDEVWRHELLDRAAGLLESSLKADGRELSHRVFRSYHLAREGPLDYRKLAEEHGVRESDISNHLVFAKARFREILTDLVAETVSDPAELHDEMRTLFGAGPS